MIIIIIILSGLSHVEMSNTTVSEFTSWTECLLKSCQNLLSQALFLATSPSWKNFPFIRYYSRLLMAYVVLSLLCFRTRVIGFGVIFPSPDCLSPRKFNVKPVLYRCTAVFQVMYSEWGWCVKRRKWVHLFPSNF